MCIRDSPLAGCIWTAERISPRIPGRLKGGLPFLRSKETSLLNIPLAGCIWTAERISPRIPDVYKRQVKALASAVLLCLAVTGLTALVYPSTRAALLILAQNILEQVLTFLNL